MLGFQQILLNYLVADFFAFSLLAVAVGIGLIVCSQYMFRIFAVMNRYVSTRKVFRVVSIRHDLGELIQCYR